VASSVGATSSGLAEPPASAEAAILSELLTTGSFATSVAEHSLLGKSLGSPAAIRAKAAGLLSNGQLVQSVPGGQVLEISYSASSPEMAKSVLGALITQLRTYTNRLTAQHAQAAVAYDKAQAKAAQAALATARSNVAAYQAQHPGVSHTDPTYVSLVAAESNALTQLSQANTALSQATGTGSDGWSMQVIDPPSQASTTTPHKSKIAEVILAGALGGALVSFLAVVALTPVRKERWEDELPIGRPLVPDVPSSGSFRNGSSGVHTPPVAPSPAATAVGAARRSLGDRRFQFRTSSAPTEKR
jgi:uncharacterized protein involved in exopolysaccharide biosynthesis